MRRATANGARLPRWLRSARKELHSFQEEPLAGQGQRDRRLHGAPEKGKGYALGEVHCSRTGRRNRRQNGLWESWGGFALEWDGKPLARPEDLGGSVGGTPNLDSADSDPLVPGSNQDVASLPPSYRPGWRVGSLLRRAGLEHDDLTPGEIRPGSAPGRSEWGVVASPDEVQDPFCRLGPDKASLMRNLPAVVAPDSSGLGAPGDALATRVLQQVVNEGQSETWCGSV